MTFVNGRSLATDRTRPAYSGLDAVGQGIEIPRTTLINLPLPVRTPTYRVRLLGHLVEP